MPAFREITDVDQLKELLEIVEHLDQNTYILDGWIDWMEGGEGDTTLVTTSVEKIIENWKTNLRGRGIDI